MQEVGGSIPPGSTSLRWLRQLRLGKPSRSEGCRAVARRAKAGSIKTNRCQPSLASPASARQALSQRRLPRRSPKGEGGLFTNRRVFVSFRPARWGGAMKYVYILESLDSEHFYVGITDDVPTRLIKHNAGEVPHTSKYRPWRIKTYVAFSDEKQAFAFEKYLKSGYGRAFAKKRL
jgi:putative endonuclease